MICNYIFQRFWVAYPTSQGESSRDVGQYVDGVATHIHKKTPVLSYVRIQEYNRE